MASFDMDRRVAGFDWDSGNRDKCRKHGVSTAEIESLFHGTVNVLGDRSHSTATEKRYLAIGRTDRGRHVLVAFTLRERDGQTFIRPISARYMHRKEIERYEKENPDA